MLVAISIRLRITDRILTNILMNASDITTITNSNSTTFSGFGDSMKSSTIIWLTHGVKRLTADITKNIATEMIIRHLNGFAISHSRFMTLFLSIQCGQIDEPGGSGLPHFSQKRTRSFT